MPGQIRLVLCDNRLLVSVACFSLFLACCGSSIFAQDNKSSEKTRPDFSAEQIEFFEREVRPILVDRCLECHDPQVGEPSGGLSLTSRSDILVGGDSGPAIEPGDPVNSLLIEAVRHGERVQMPPDEKIPLEEIAVLMKWIEQKAPWPAESDQRSHREQAFDLEQRRAEHWAWQTPANPALPAVQNSHWPLDPLDHFILDRLEQVELSPAKPAEAETWFRRVHFDILGLPPTVDEVLSFQRDWNNAVTGEAIAALPTALPAVRKLKQAVVDRLLADPGFGEHWARHWLDLVRYAETFGHEFDYAIPGAFEYRDYVIRALNQDVPYDQFVREHIAGDLLLPPRRHPTAGFNESVLGTSFWYFGEAIHAPVDVAGDAANRLDNQIDVFGKTFLGLTIACARCHDHKFDAISAQDYYAISGILSGTRRDFAVIDSERSHETHLSKLQTLYREVDELLEKRFTEVEQWLERPDSEINEALESFLQAMPGEIAPPFTAVGDDHPLHVLNSYAKRPSGQTVSDWWSNFRLRILEHHAAAVQFQEDAQRLTDFSSADRGKWLATGWAFAMPSASRWRPAPFGANSQPSLPTTSPAWLATPPHIVDSRFWGDRLSGTLRSPTFRITAPKLHVLARGQNAKVRLVIDGYQMNQYQELLFSETSATINSPQFEWRTMAGDIGKYVGRQAYLELVDEGEGFISVDQVWMGGERPVQAPSPTLVHLCATYEQIEDASQLAEMIAGLFAATKDGHLELPAMEVEPTGPEQRGNSPRAANAKDSESGTELRALRETSGRSRTRRVKLSELEIELIKQWLVNWSLDAEQRTSQLTLGADKRLESQIFSAVESLQVPVSTRKSFVATPSEGLDQALFIRGNHRNLGDMVPRGTLTALRQIPVDPAANKSDPSGRLALALGVASRDNPLTARVFVNRVWHHLLREGIVSSPDDMGVMGTAPTHPDLLDHLAITFVAQQWSLKSLIRRVVLSQTYAMSTESSELARERDPGNELLQAFRVRRLSGEEIRDAMLQVSGRMKRQFYGPSIPTHVTDLMQGRGRPSSGPLDGEGRRSVYLEVRRNFLNPWMLVFDTPTPFSTMGKRNRSNVPAQALALMNDPLVHELATSWTRQIRTLPGDDQQRLEQMFLAALGRQIEPLEREALLEYLDATSTVGLNGETAVAVNDGTEREAAWIQIAHTLFNLKEFIFLQ